MNKVKNKKLSINDSNKNILVISHTCFSKNDSMGSTLANYFHSFDKHRLYQFYFKDMQPNCFEDAHYYKWTDKEALHLLFNPFSKKNKGTGKVGFVEIAQSSKKDKMVDKACWSKRSRALMLRHSVWSISYKLNHKFRKWVKEVKPRAIVLMPGDFQFVFKLAYKIASKYNIPILIMQCESYLLKPMFSKNIWYKIYRHSFKKWYTKAMKLTQTNIYLCKELCDDYKKIFPSKNHITIYKPFAPIHIERDGLIRTPNSFVYAGNLGFATGRAEALYKLCNLLSAYKYKIDVYTNTPINQLEKLISFENVNVYGLLKYEELVSEYYKHEYIIHIENSSELHLEDLKYAFSTKICDILAYGCLGVVVGSSDIAGINYLKTNKAALVFDKPSKEIISTINSINSKEKNQIIHNAISLLNNNHAVDSNSKAFENELNKLVN